MKTLKCITWRGYDTPLVSGHYLQRHMIDVEFVYASNDDQTLDSARRGHIDLVGGPEI